MRQYFNKNLITLKCVLFAFFAGIGCLFPFMTAHIRAVGLTFEEACIISIVASFLAILGPLIFGPLADKLSVGRGCETTIANGKTDNPNASIIISSNNGVLRFMIAACILLAALFYALLMTVPYAKMLEPRRPSVSFMCDANGATVFQEMCTEEKTCNHWDNEKLGSLLLSGCHYDCERPPVARPLYLESTSTSEDPMEADDDVLDNDDSELDVEPEATIPDDGNQTRTRRALYPPNVESPHLCYTSLKHPRLCEAFTEDTKRLKIDASLLSAIDEEHEQDESDAENGTIWCKYPMGGNFQCLVPPNQVTWMAAMEENNTCKPVIQCNVEDPYDSPNSVLAESQCKLFIGDPSFSFWSYLILRSLADIFSTAALCLLCTACVIATRETSIGRGDVGTQLMFGVIGITIIPPLIGILNTAFEETSPAYVIPITSAVILFVIAAVTMLLTKEMPLSPPEWWWHTKSGMVALPMNTVRRYGLEIVGVMLVLVVLGIFWSALNTYMPWAVKEMYGSDMILSLTMSVGALPAIPILWKAEPLVDYCGHSNIFIAAFTFYILKYTGMAVLHNPWWVLMCEALEVFTLSLMWVTAVLYFRHLIPRKYTSTGQALPVVAHFCLGRCFGALIGLAVKKNHLMITLQSTYEAMAIAASVLGIVYLALYHLLLAPWCRASTTGPPNPIAMQGLNGNGTSNGNYTPLRVYHNERGRKGQFRY